jgi:hypothetical protein
MVSFTLFKQLQFLYLPFTGHFCSVCFHSAAVSRISVAVSSLGTWCMFLYLLQRVYQTKKNKFHSFVECFFNVWNASDVVSLI